MIKELKQFNFLKKDLNRVIKDLKNNYMEIDENEFDEFKSEYKQEKEVSDYVKKKLKENYKFSEEDIIINEDKIKDIICFSNYILINSEKTKNYEDSKIELLIKNFIVQINNSYKIYEKNLKIMCVNSFFENLIPLMILRNSVNKTNSISINAKYEGEEEKKILKLKELHYTYSEEIEEYFKEYESKIASKVENLLPLAGKKEFKEKMQRSDYEIKKFIEDMNSCITKKMEKLNEEIENILQNVLEELDCKIDSQKFTQIKEMVNGYFGIGVASASILGGGVVIGFGVGSVSSALISINAGVAASLGVPVVNIVAGSIALLGGTIYLLYRWLRNEEKYDKAALKSFKAKNDEEMQKSMKNIKDFIRSNIEKAIEKVKFFYSIDKENLDEFKKNIDLFEKYYIEFENIMDVVLE